MNQSHGNLQESYGDETKQSKTNEHLRNQLMRSDHRGTDLPILPVQSPPPGEVTQVLPVPRRLTMLVGTCIGPHN